ncbi:DUF3618 domain-containing protein [Azospirillum halopraeferens]|uniref:DUF3618 domain-containing protein n=1 Tax=Azospirillum halopraeferens TaxID=34010 RepID=UPI000685FCAA|nr:DUF3618 domain-containing protein [Azospirillum halopraeferens]
MADDRSESTPAAHDGRSMGEIEREIGAIRARMDATLDELEYRLSPGQMTGHVTQAVRDVIEGRPTRIARAIRDNPIPVALIGIGALWLAWAISRTPEHDESIDHGGHPGISDQRARILLTGLIGACRQGAEGCREADAALYDGRLSPRLIEVSNELERSAAALGHELRVRGGVLDADGPLHPAWHDLFQELAGARGRAQVLAALERGLDGTLGLFRDCLHEDLSPELRVVVGARFHELETIRHRMASLREALA